MLFAITKSLSSVISNEISPPFYPHHVPKLPLRMHYPNRLTFAHTVGTHFVALTDVPFPFHTRLRATGVLRRYLPRTPVCYAFCRCLQIEDPWCHRDVSRKDS